MNYVSLLGRLTKDPELKYSQSGKAFCKFTIAVTREFNREEADFINCVAWDKRAEAIAEYLRKGRRIAIQGRLNVSNYEKNGETVWRTDVVVDKFDFIDSANTSNMQSQQSQQPQSSQNAPVNNSFVDNDNDEIIDDDDFPF